MTTQTYSTRIRTLYATAATFAASNPVLLEGEPATESDTGKEKIGNGVTAWNSLPYKPSSVARSFNFVQSSAAATWTINHNLGFKPSVELLNSGSQEIDGDVVHTSANQVVVTFNVPVSGFARLA
jgi:hypothetical protein